MRVVEGCDRCLPGMIDLGHNQPGHRASAMLARAGWMTGSEATLRRDPDAATGRLRGFGPVTRALVRERLGG